MNGTYSLRAKTAIHLSQGTRSSSVARGPARGEARRATRGPTTTFTHRACPGRRFPAIVRRHPSYPWLAILTLGAGLLWGGGLPHSAARASELLAGVAKADITDRDGRLVNDPLYVKALVLKDDAKTVALITVDVVAIGQIGRIKNDYLPTVRARLKQELNIEPNSVLITASHCHGVPLPDIVPHTVQAVAEACQKLEPVRVGAGAGHEDRISENRRLRLKDGGEADVRHAYSLVADEQVAGIGPIDPEIGLLRIDRQDGRPLAVVYNFACHPIQGVPSRGNSADIIGFASAVIEQNLGDGVMALFVQGCAGDINPAQYKDVHNPRDAEPLGNLLGLSALRALRQIQTRDQAPLKLVHDVLTLPRSADSVQRIARLQAEQASLLKSLKGTSLNLKTFLPLYVQYKLAEDFPSYSSHRYLLDEALGRKDLANLDAENRANMQAYIRNIMAMEQLTRVQENLRLLEMHQRQNAEADGDTLDAEVVGLRVGEFVLLTFPGELTVEIGLKLKQQAPREHTFIAGYTNGYIYYTPTAAQRNNSGHAQEDCDCLVAPQWQELFEQRAMAILSEL